MSNVTLELDMVGADEGPWELDGLQDLGTVLVQVVDPHGPVGGNPVVRVSGPRAAVLLWLLAEYVPLQASDVALSEAMDLLRPAAEGGALVAG